MAAVIVPVQLPTSTGMEITAVAADDQNGFLVPNNGGTFIAVTNNAAAGASGNLHLVTVQTVDGLNVADRVIPTVAKSTVYFNRLSPGVYNDSLGRVAITISGLAQNGAASMPTYPQFNAWAAR